MLTKFTVVVSRFSLIVAGMVAIQFAFLSGADAQRKRGRSSGKQSSRKNDQGAKKNQREQAPARSSARFSPQKGEIGTKVYITNVPMQGLVTVFVGGVRVWHRKDKKKEAYSFRVPQKYGNGIIDIKFGRKLERVGKFEVPPPKIKTVYPREASPGTTVYIKGEGFARGDRVLLGSKPLRIRGLSKRHIVAVLPDAIAPGPTNFVVERSRFTSIRHPKPFEVLLPPPKVNGFEPEIAYRGDFVTLEVENFTPTSRVFFGSTALEIVDYGPGWVTVVISRKVRFSKHLSVRGRNGNGRSQNKLEIGKRSFVPGSKRDDKSGGVVFGPPKIRKITPAAAREGQSVRVSGANFEPTARLFYGSNPLKVIKRGPNWVDIVAPAGTKFDKYIWLKNEEERTRAPTKLVIARKPGGSSGGYSRDGSTRGGSPAPSAQKKPTPAITKFAPRFAKPGERVRIAGKDFKAKTSVLYGSLPVKVAERGDGWLEIIAPDNTKADEYLWVKDSVGRGRSSAKLGISRPETKGGASSGEPRGEETPSPVISKFSPISAKPGDRIRIEGKNFKSDVKVLYGTVPIKVVEHGDNWVEILAPENTRVDQYLWLEAAQGRGRSAKKLELFREEAPAEASPAIASEDVAGGSDLARAAALVPPSIEELTPKVAAEGAIVDILGANFLSDSKVFYGSFPVEIVERTGALLKIRVPERTRRDEYLLVKGPNGEARSPVKFVIERPPVILSFSPMRAPAGSEVKIVGRNFIKDDTVKVGGTVAIIKDRSATHLTIIVPRYINRGYIRIYRRDPTIRAKSGSRLQIR